MSTHSEMTVFYNVLQHHGIKFLLAVDLDLYGDIESRLIVEQGQKAVALQAHKILFGCEEGGIGWMGFDDAAQLFGCKPMVVGEDVVLR